MPGRSNAFRLRFCGVTAALLLGSMAAPARADLIITVLDSVAQPGDTGVTFDVTLTNTGLAGVDVGGFQVELSVPGASGIHFTDATIATAAPYIFGIQGSGSPLNNDPLNPFPNTDFTGIDNAFTPTGVVTIAGGSTLGLEHVLFSVDAGTPIGPITVTVVPFDSISHGGTQLTDVNGDPVPASFVNGTITVRLRSVPEPSAVLLVGVGGGLMFLRRRHRSIAA